jgi:hypothetical protein
VTARRNIEAKRRDWTETAGNISADYRFEAVCPFDMIDYAEVHVN